MKGSKEDIKVCESKSTLFNIPLQKFSISVRKIEDRKIYWVEYPFDNAEEMAHCSDLIRNGNEIYFSAKNIKVNIETFISEVI